MPQSFGSVSGETLVPDVLQGKFSPLLMLHLHNLRFCSLVFERQFVILLEMGEGQLGAGPEVTGPSMLWNV